MTQFDKLVEQLKARPPRARYSDVRRLLEAYGWELNRQTGSHAHFKKAGERTQTVKLIEGRYVARFILDQILQKLGLDD